MTVHLEVEDRQDPWCAFPHTHTYTSYGNEQETKLQLDHFATTGPARFPGMPGKPY